MSEAKKYVYLLQGQAKYIDKFAALRNRKNADLFCLTYDTPKENCIFLPNSNWAEGRNRLLAEALKTKTSYLYFTFLDDDVRFKKGGWDEWEARLLKLKPAIAFPIFSDGWVNKYSIIGKIIYPSYDARCGGYDEQMIAYHKDIVTDGILLPYVLFAEQPNALNSNSDIWFNLVKIFYSKWAIRFTSIVTTNYLHRYTKLSILEYQQIARGHLLKNLNPKYHSRISIAEAPKPNAKPNAKPKPIIEKLSTYRKIRRFIYRKVPLLKLLYDGLSFNIRDIAAFKYHRQYQPKDNYLTSLEFKREVFHPDSVLYPKE